MIPLKGNARPKALLRLNKKYKKTLKQKLTNIHEIRITIYNYFNTLNT